MTKQSKIILFIISILFIIYAIVIDLYCNKVHAQTTSFAWGSSVVSTTSGSSLEISRSTNFMANLGEGKILFNFSLTGNAQIFNVLAVTYNNGTATNWQCDFSSMVTYLGNQETTQTATAICPVGYTGNQGLRKIQVTFRQNGGVGLGLGDYYTFTNADINNVDYTTLLNTINTNLSNLNTKEQASVNKLNDINTNMVSKMNDILSILQTNNSSLETKIQQQTQQQHQDSQNTQQKIDNIDNTLKDSSIDSNNTSSSTSAWNNKNATNGTITNLLTLPIQLMQGYVNGMNSSCTPFNLGDLFGTTIILPCINVGSLIGSSLWSVIDVLFSGFMIFGIAKKLIKIFNDFTNMKSNQVDELYGGGA